MTDIDEIRRHTYFGMLLATSAQIYEPGHTVKAVVDNAARLIEACAEKAEVGIDEIR